MRTSAFALAATLLFLPSVGRAQDNEEIEVQAKHRMHLSFDLDKVRHDLQNPPPAAQPAASAQSWGQAAPPPLPLEPNSKTEAVTVFSDRALVTRVLTRTVPKGATTITFEGLPLGIDARSLHASLRHGDARIVGVELESGTGKVEQTERIEAIRKQSLALTDQLGVIQDRIESLLSQRAYLRGALLSPPGQGTPPGLAQVKSTLQYVGDAEADIARQLREQEKQAKDLDKKVSPLLVKLDNPLATGRRVRVDLDAAQPGDVEIALRYEVGGAGWVPAYDARLDPKTNQVTLEYYGVVTQGTGEAWTDATLALSTAHPATSGSLPKLTSWILGAGDQVDSGKGYFVSGEGRDVVRGEDGAVLSAEITAAVRGGGTTVFTIPGKRDVRGDGSAVRLPIGRQTFAANVALATVPKLVPAVFRRATLRYGGTLPLLPGTVSSYVGGDFVGSGAIGSVVPGEDLKLSFGTDDRLKVTRRLVSRKQEYVGFGKRTVRDTFQFRIAVANHTRTAQIVELADQVPVSQSDKVTVKELEISEGRLASDTDAPGVLRWKLTIPPGEERAVTIGFSVTGPVEQAKEYEPQLQMMY